MRIEDMIIGVQRKLGVFVDGKAGPQTWNAIHDRIVNTQTAAAPQLNKETLSISPVDERSEKNIATLQTHVKPMARALVYKAASIGINIKIISGTRTYAEQDALYAQGRTKPGQIVTSARAGYSNHNFGIAFDVGVFEGTKYITDISPYIAVGAIGIELGLEWGGNWKTFVDYPHFQLRPAWANGWKESEMLAELRRMQTNDGIFSA